MVGDIGLQCPACGTAALADDEFCESCGAPFGRHRDARREHVEVDAGVVAGVSDRGLRHERNEDAVFVASDGPRAVAVVCDGVSVSAAPQVASEVAAGAAGQWLLGLVRCGSVGAIGADAMVEGLGRTGDAVADLPWLAVPERNGPSCTVVAAVWDGAVITIGWAGDSRAYWLDGQEVRLLTVDHSWAQEQVANGTMTPAMADIDPRAHAITRWLGDDAPAGAETTTWTPEVRGRLVLCTDGLWNLLRGPDELAEIAASAGDRSALGLARCLVSTALGRGGPDNVTVAVIEVEPGSALMEFRADTYQNEYLPAGGTAVDAVLTVVGTAGGPVAPAGGPVPEAAVVVVIDLSGSMGPRPKLVAARQSVVAAIESLRDGVQFGVIAGTHEARYVYPEHGLARAEPRTRAAAVKAVQRCGADGGTAMGRWLLAARDRLIDLPGVIRNVILLTDGHNESESREQLDAAVAACDGVFQCDCRGIGTDWHVDELRAIATRLLGSVDIIPDPEAMPDDFAAMTARAMAKRTADVTLRLWTPRGAEVGFVKQVSPTIDDLSARGRRVDDRTVDYPTGAWGDEERDYHVHLVVPAHEVGAELLAGRVSLVVDGEVVTRSMVRAVWTDDHDASTRINPHVAHYTGQEGLASAIADGLSARAAGDDHTASRHLGLAARLAAESGNDATLRLLAGVVDIVDAATGTVRLRRDVAAADEMALDTRSTRTVRTRNV